MPKIAFVFPGQGSQQAGMGKDLLEDPEVADLCEKCSRASDVDLKHLLITADDEELKLTQNAQPALCFVGIGLTLLLERRGIEPAAAAGHSVGEYAALAISGAAGAPQVVKGVVERGRAMAQALPADASSMAAVLGLSAEAVEAALAGIEGVWPANYNTPTQTVIAGTTAGLARATDSLQAARQRRLSHAVDGPRCGTPSGCSRAHRLAIAEGASDGQPHGARAPGRRPDPARDGDAAEITRAVGRLRRLAGRPRLRHVHRGWPQARSHGDDARAGAGRRSGRGWHCGGVRGARDRRLRRPRQRTVAYRNLAA